MSGVAAPHHCWIQDWWTQNSRIPEGYRFLSDLILGIFIARIFVGGADFSLRARARRMDRHRHRRFAVVSHALNRAAGGVLRHGVKSECAFFESSPIERNNPIRLVFGSEGQSALGRTVLLGGSRALYGCARINGHPYRSHGHGSLGIGELLRYGSLGSQRVVTHHGNDQDCDHRSVGHARHAPEVRRFLSWLRLRHLYLLIITGAIADTIRRSVAEASRPAPSTPSGGSHPGPRRCRRGSIRKTKCGRGSADRSGISPYLRIRPGAPGNRAETGVRAGATVRRRPRRGFACCPSRSEIPPERRRRNSG